ncbi:DUF6883 domain-containing protein [uncultured Methylobacterium sp.]|uniref:DUF6883 domain-containing protein n=1 Tax=uncultured Methylobacterium sp. TaxID=157278 RepID=UPI002595251C|nr:DUF6883 domain-containing protein [uncultured Methylobacterium sp.]
MIDGPKISAYLLNAAHPRGASKAKYLMGFGFTPEDPGALAAALVAHALSNGPGVRMVPPKGAARSVFEGTVTAPDGREMPRRTVWELRSPEEMHLITAVPLTR